MLVFLFPLFISSPDVPGHLNSPSLKVPRFVSRSSFILLVYFEVQYLTLCHTVKMHIHIYVASHSRNIYLVFTVWQNLQDMRVNIKNDLDHLSLLSRTGIANSVVSSARPVGDKRKWRGLRQTGECRPPPHPPTDIPWFGP